MCPPATIVGILCTSPTTSSIIIMIKRKQKYKPLQIGQNDGKKEKSISKENDITKYQ